MSWSTASPGVTVGAWLPAFTERWSSFSDRSWGTLTPRADSSVSRNRNPDRRERSRCHGLDSMALQYDRAHSVLSMERQRQHRVDSAQEVREDAKASNYMSREGKNLFDQAVSHARAGADDIGSRVSSIGVDSLPSLSSSRTAGRGTPSYASRHNGPTKYGSPIYLGRSRSPIATVTLQPSDQEVRLREHLKRLNETHRVVYPASMLDREDEVPLAACVIVPREERVKGLEDPVVPIVKKSPRPATGSSKKDASTQNATPIKNATWIDDVTISSSQHKPEPEQGEGTPDASPAHETPGSPADEGETPNKTPVVLNLADLGESDIEVALPNLICPSSELKSREFGVRHWLKTTSFPCAIRTAPLL